MLDLNELLEPHGIIFGDVVLEEQFETLEGDFRQHSNGLC